MSIQREKVLQAIDLLKEENIDMWITIGRETMMNSDPVIPLISASEFGGMTAAILCSNGKNLLVANHLDASGHELSKVYDQVIEYTEYDIFIPLKELFAEIKPKKLALNYSDDVAADGLTVGLYNKVMKFLKEIGFEGEVCSSENVIARLRGQKSPQELEAIKEAIQITQSIFGELKSYIKEGITDTEIFNYCKDRMAFYKVTDAWDANANPIVSVRNDSAGGHAGTIGLVVAKGDIVRLDFGVKKNGYCSDLQRVFYVAKDGETEPPKDVIETFDAVQKGIQLGAAKMNIGTEIDVPDNLVKKYLADSDLPVYRHSLGHQVGMFAHDGGVSMSKRWVDEAKEQGKKYQFIENMVYTVEFGVASSRGECAQEDMVVIRPDGVEWISQIQDKIYICN